MASISSSPSSSDTSSGTSTTLYLLLERVATLCTEFLSALLGPDADHLATREGDVPLTVGDVLHEGYLDQVGGGYCNRLVGDAILNHLTLDGGSGSLRLPTLLGGGAYL